MEISQRLMDDSMSFKRDGTGSFVYSRYRPEGNDGSSSILTCYCVMNDLAFCVVQSDPI